MFTIIEPVADFIEETTSINHDTFETLDSLLDAWQLDLLSRRGDLSLSDLMKWARSSSPGSIYILENLAVVKNKELV